MTLRPPTSETSISRAIQQCLKANGVLFERVQSGMLQATYKGRTRWIHCASEGCPDLWTELGWLEIKTPTGRLSPEQKAWHERARKRRVRVHVVRSVRDVMKLIEIEKVSANCALC